MSGIVLVLSHPDLAGHLKIVAIGGASSTGAAGDTTTGPGCKALFYIVVGRPGEVSRRTWHELRHFGGTEGWLRCPAEFAIATVQRIAAQAVEEEKYAASVRCGRAATLAQSETVVSSASVHRIHEIEPVAGGLSSSQATVAGQALEIGGSAQTETCSACRNEVPSGAARCTVCNARLIRFEEATDPPSALAIPHEPSG